MNDIDTEQRVVSAFLENLLRNAKERNDIPAVLQLERVLSAFDAIVGELSAFDAIVGEEEDDNGDD